jgi:ATP-dependent Zn protease
MPGGVKGLVTALSLYNIIAAHVDRSKRRTDARTKTAYHEAGHAVLGAAISDRPHFVTIRPDGHTLGRSRAFRSPRPTARVQVHLAGVAAEHLLTGRRSRQFDREVGSAILSRQYPALGGAFEGLAACDSYRAVEEVLAMNGLGITDDVRTEVDRLYEAARHSLAAVWSSVKAVADALLAHEELDRDGVDLAIGDDDIYKPVFAVQHARDLLSGGAADLISRVFPDV